MKKLLSLILVFVLLFSLISCNDEPPTPNDGDTTNDGGTTGGTEDTPPATDDGGTTNGGGTTDGDENASTSPAANPITDFEYSYSERYGGIGITKYVGTSKSIVFPEEIEGQPVKIIGGYLLDHFEMRPFLESVVIPDTVEIIADMTFSDCVSLVSVDFGNGVLEIGYEAFRGCKALKKIILPPKLERIGTNAFFGCSSATEIFIPKSVKTWEYDTSKGTFSGCTSLKKLTFEEGLEQIGYWSTFMGAEALEQVEIPASVKKIAPLAFNCCPSLTTVVFKGDAPDVEEGYVFGYQEFNENLVIYYDPNTEGWQDTLLHHYTLKPID